MEPMESLYNELLSGNPSRETLYRILSWMMKEGMTERVAEECAKALEAYPDDVGIRRLLAEAYFKTGRAQEAESEIRSVIAGVNELMTCYRFHADLLISQDRKDEAVEALKIYLIHCPDDRDAYALLDSMLPAEAAQTEEEAAQAPCGEEGAVAKTEEESHGIATATLAELYFKQGMPEEAIGIYKKVVEHNPEDSASRSRLEELVTMAEQARLSEERAKDVLMRKRRLMSIMEAWLEGIREQARPGLSAG